MPDVVVFTDNKMIVAWAGEEVKPRAMAAPLSGDISLQQTGLGLALRTLRERRTLTLRELSQLADVDHAYVHRLETGEKTSPSSEVVGKLLKVLKPAERDAGIIRWLVDHPEADPALVSYTLATENVELEIFTAAAGVRHRGTARPDPATLIDRVRRAFE